jgi:formylglycine-generating enzyme required for sulfatase activity
MNGYFNLSLVPVDGVNYDGYWGSVELTVSGDFGAVDVRSSNADVLGGDGLLVFNDGTLLTAATNPITILVDEDKTVGATFIEDTSDADGDGLTGYQEHVLYGTDPDLEDTDGDTHSDFLELINFGSDPLDAASVPTYQLTINAFNGTVTGAGAIEIQTETTLTATADAGFVFAGWSGTASGADNPLTLLVDADKTIGADFIASANYTRIEQLGVDAGVTQGEAAVQAAPGDYGLYTAAEFQGNYTTGLTEGIAQGEALVVADPGSYDLLNTEMVYAGLRLGGMRIQNTGSSQLISFNIESSDDLKTWTLEERIERELLMPESGPLFIRVSVPVEDIVPLVTIPAGSFQMGDGFSEDSSNERPVHTVELRAYKIGETEVTWGQWQEVRDWAVNNGYSDLAGVGAGKGSDHPVHSVNWYDVVKWSNAASEKIGLEPVYYVSGAVYRTGEGSPFIDYSKSGYRLPTEAEWEKAARGGLEGARFPWGDTISHAEANYYADPSGYSYDVNGSEGVHPDYDEGGYPYTSPVVSFAANGYGLYDVAGNLWEWCGDWYGSSYYGSAAASDPAGPDSGSSRVVRGGYWGPNASSCRVAARYYYGPSDRYYSIGGVGFRLARSVGPQ